MRKVNDILQQVRERELTDKELKRREEIADDLPDAEFKKRYGAAWKGIKMATATNMAKKEEVDLEEALSGREVAKRMEKLKDRGVYVLKPWAKEVAKMRTVTRDDLEKLLPDHIGGQYLTKVLESNELIDTYAQAITDAVKKEDHPNHKKKVKPGYHIMPDGTMMKDSEHKKESKDLEKELNDNADETLDRIREANVQKGRTMRNILADIWKVNEGKSPFDNDKKEEQEDKPLKKTLTGKKTTKVEIEPEIK